jgi:hypothetical protein
VYLDAWKMWAPRKRKMRELKLAAQKKVTEVRMRCIVRGWSQRVQNVLLIYAYGNDRLLSAEHMYRMSALAAAHCLAGRTPNFVQLTCWRKWVRYTRGVRRWRSLKFWSAVSKAEHLVKTVFRAWFYATGKNHQPSAHKLSTEPYNMIDRGKSMMQKIDVGYDVSNSIRYPPHPSQPPSVPR